MHKLFINVQLSSIFIYFTYLEYRQNFNKTICFSKNALKYCMCEVKIMSNEQINHLISWQNNLHLY